MKFHIEWLVFESINTADEVARMRQQAAPLLRQLLEDKRVSASGHYMGRRGGFFVIEATEDREIMQILGPLVDQVEFRIQPLISIEAVLQKFANQAQ